MNELKGEEFYAFDPQREPERVIANYLFNYPEHLLLQAKKNWRVFGLSVKGKPTLQLALHIKDNIAQSPLKAPFGSFQSVGRITPRYLKFFIEKIETSLRRPEGTVKVVIKSYPEAYQASTSQLLYTNLTAWGYALRIEVSSIIEVDKIDFERKIKISERQKLRKSKGRFRFQHVPPVHLPAVYQFIENCRQQKDQSLSMTLMEIQETAKKFKNDFLLFEVSENDTMVAAAIVIRINKKILYTFYYAHAGRLNKISPTVFLLSGIYSYAQQHGYQLIDLGTSMTGNKVNGPLLHFKESVGGRPSLKYTFEKTLS